MLAEHETRFELQAPAMLKLWRERRGLTQADLAITSGVQQSELIKAEIGLPVLAFHQVTRLSRALQVRLDNLL